jgi:ubiquinone/menaquinone biosynthesis C-methylase UbiE
VHNINRFYPETRFGGFTDVDGSLVFYTRVHELIQPGAVALDVGCGRGMHASDPVRVRRRLRDLRVSAERVIGIDVDEAAADNPLIHEFRRITGPRWPVEDQSIDVVVADWVIEHVADPAVFFAEAVRVLRPGGSLCMRTSNVQSLFGLAARLVPNYLHARVLQTARHGREAQDVFPTLYRCNTVRRLRRMLNRAGFDPCVYGYEAEPTYLHFSTLAYFLGVLHQRLAPKRLRASIFAFARRK